MKIALAQINPIVGDFDYNIKKIKDFAGQAAGRGCDLVVFPELAISGYPPRDLLEKKDFVAAGLACLERLVDTLRGIGVVCGVADINPAEAGNPLFNSAVLFENGRVLQKVAKRLLPTYDVFDECRYFEPGAVYRTVAYRGRRLGLTVCEDVWNDKDVFKHRIYPSDPVALLVENGAELIVNISASPFHAGKDAFRSRMLATIAGKYRLPLIFVNQVGGNDSLLFDGLSTAFAATGEVAARASDFVEDLVVYDLETGRGECHPAAASEVAAVHRALVMGTRDYVTKCGFAQAVVGLSGGVDSALTAAIAVEALGAGNGAWDCYERDHSYPSGPNVGGESFELDYDPHNTTEGDIWDYDLPRTWDYSRDSCINLTYMFFPDPTFSGVITFPEELVNDDGVPLTRNAHLHRFFAKLIETFIEIGLWE